MLDKGGDMGRDEEQYFIAGILDDDRECTWCDCGVHFDRASDQADDVRRVFRSNLNNTPMGLTL